MATEAGQARAPAITSRPEGSPDRTRRPKLDKALRIARRGDQLVITKLDRLGRSLERLIEIANVLQASMVGLVILDQGTAPPQSVVAFSSGPDLRAA